RSNRDWSSDVCSSDLAGLHRRGGDGKRQLHPGQHHRAELRRAHPGPLHLLSAGRAELCGQPRRRAAGGAERMVRPVSGMQRTCRWLSPLGPMLLAAEGDWLTGAWFEGQKYFGRTLAAGRAEGDAPVLTLARRWLEVYFSGREPDFAVPLRPSGTPFQQEVWAALREIPYGQTTTYGAIARQM